MRKAKDNIISEMITKLQSVKERIDSSKSLIKAIKEIWGGGRQQREKTLKRPKTHFSENSNSPHNSYS